VIEALLAELDSRKQLSEERYAEERSRILSRKYGAARIRHDLRSKGLPDAIVARVSTDGELARAQNILSRKYREPALTREERAKRARFLQSRGFCMDVINRLIRGDEAA
jgi:regulatory protein